jgi:DNA ligase (NAD+)
MELLVQEFRKKGISFLHSFPEQTLIDLLNAANIQYRNNQPFMTDTEYDILQDYVAKKYPHHSILQQIGAPVEKNKVKLPYFMGSMDKIKPNTGVLSQWKSKYNGPYVLSCKLDGVSGLYSTEGGTPQLYTRGDGSIGQNIRHLIPYLRLPNVEGIVIRGEFVMPKSVFYEKYKTLFANPRNMVSGIVNQKKIDPTILSHLDFVAYEVIRPIMKPSKQMEFLKTIRHLQVVQSIVSEDITNESLSKMLVSQRDSYTYEIDGIIVTQDAIYEERKMGNPEHAFAFKMAFSDQIAEAIVVDVLWTPSKDGYLKPRVQIEPIQLNGVQIEYATGFNGAFIRDNKIGIGAIIELIRSGDVIPHIRKVITPAVESKMPLVSYTWNSTGVDILLEDIESDKTVQEKNITGFFKGIQVDGLSSGNITRIMNAGYNTVPAILKMTVADFMKIEGFQKKMSEKIFEGIQTKIKEASLLTIMSASNVFGRGIHMKKMELILKEYPDILTSVESDLTAVHVQNCKKTEKINEIKGMGTKTAEAFVEKIPAFVDFMKKSDLMYKLEPVSEPISIEIDTLHPLYNKTIVMTGFRDASFQQQLKNRGGKIGSTVSKNTFAVVVQNIDENTGKIADAKTLGIPIFQINDFISQFQLL